MLPLPYGDVHLGATPGGRCWKDPRELIQSWRLMLFLPYRLWDRPAVVAYQERNPERLAAMLRTLEPGTHLLFHCSGYTGGCLNFFKRLPGILRPYPRVTLHLIANTAEELESFRSLGLPVAYGPVSLYVDDATFRPETLEKRFDAVYVAHFTPGDRAQVKRHLLATGVRSLSVITNALSRRRGSIPGLTGPDVPHLFYETYPELRHAAVNDHYLAPPEVAHALNLARVNLALSAAEGCMLGFTEGLLCGVPAVSTACRSARTEFFDARFVAVVDDNAAAVAAGVREVAARGLAAADVREFALSRQRVMRTRYAAYVAGIVGVPSEVVLAHWFGAPGGLHHLAYVPQSSSGAPEPPKQRARPERALGVRRRW